MLGDTLTVPAGVVHAVRNAGRGNASESATYVAGKASRSSRWPSERQLCLYDHPLLAPARQRGGLSSSRRAP
jgi:hypothetical protein